MQMISAVPGLFRRRHASVAVALRALLLAVALGPLVVFTCCDNGFTLGKAVYVRTLMSLALALWVPLLMYVPGYRPRLTPISVGLLAVAAVAALATLTSSNPWASFWSDYGPHYGLLGILQYTLLALMASSVFRTWGHFRWWLAVIVAASVPMTLVVLGHGYDVTVSWLPNHYWDNRSGSTVGFATYATVHATLIVVSALVLLLTLRWRDGRGSRALIVLGMTGLFCGIYLMSASASRAGFVFLFVVLVTLFVGIAATSGSWRTFFARTCFMTLALAAAAALLAAHWLATGQAEVLTRLRPGDTAEQSASGRKHALLFALRGFQERPLTGWGPERYNEVWTRHSTVDTLHRDVWIRHSHNRLTELLVTQGALGALAHVFLMACVAAAAFRLWRRSDGDGRWMALGFVLVFAAYGITGMFNRESHVSMFLGTLFFAMALHVGETLRDPGRVVTEPVPASADAPRLARAGAWPATVALVGALLLAGVVGTAYLNGRVVAGGVHNEFLGVRLVDYVQGYRSKAEAMPPMSNWLLRRFIRSLSVYGYNHGTDRLLVHEPFMHEQWLEGLERDRRDWELLYVGCQFYLVLGRDHEQYHARAASCLDAYRTLLPRNPRVLELQHYFQNWILSP